MWNLGFLFGIQFNSFIFAYFGLLATQVVLHFYLWKSFFFLTKKNIFLQNPRFFCLFSSRSPPFLHKSTQNSSRQFCHRNSYRITNYIYSWHQICHGIKGNCSHFTKSFKLLTQILTPNSKCIPFEIPIQWYAWILDWILDSQKFQLLRQKLPFTKDN